MEETIYKCICGKEFTKPNSFNAHKSNCREHLKSKGVDVSEVYKKRGESVSKTLKSKFDTKKKQDLDNWIAEKHVCENCGKIMTTLYGSGRFCSRSCANKRNHSEESRLKTSNSVKKVNSTPKLQEYYTNLGQQTRQKFLNKYMQNPKHCIVCDSIIDYDHRHRKTCSEECYKQVVGGLRQGSGTGKHGWYKNYYCDSSYELAYVIYNLDNNIEFSRNKKSYSYVGSDNKLHSYYPDFIEGNTLVEVKGYFSDDVYLKLAAVDDMPIKLLTLEHIQPLIEYVKKHYDCSDITVLYDK